VSRLYVQASASFIIGNFSNYKVLKTRLLGIYRADMGRAERRLIQLSDAFQAQIDQEQPHPMLRNVAKRNMQAM
jgi:hypothetical protein